MAGYRQPLTSSTPDVREYLNRQSQLCDSRIEDAYRRLSSGHNQSRPASSSGLEHRTLSSSSLSVPSRKHVTLDDVVRPSSAQERRSTDNKPRGILKRTESPVSSLSSSRNRSRESPDEWFQRIMLVKKLSPLDLCEIFSYGDARKHPLVPLSHVCDVLFDLDPESANGSDPVTDEMEEFLYQFSTEEGGEIVVNIREALRALNIWQSRVTSSSAQVAPSKAASNAYSKAAILESKNKKLQNVISSLQDANLRLSRQLDSAMSPKSAEQSAPPAWSPRSRATMKPSSVEVSPVKFKSTYPTKQTSFSPPSPPKTSTLLQVINLHEKELVEIASKLQFKGVKRLEEHLIEGDADSAGFVNLKQLCYILADQFKLNVSETRLIEVCMGMNFNSHAQLDYREFVDVLMDILIYALPDIRESAKRKSLLRLDDYLQSGFPPGREGARQLLDALCSTYDLEGAQCISVADLVRVFHLDLVKHHALNLPFPLEEHETIQLAQPFIQHNTQNKTPDGFVSYTELLDAILGPFPMEDNTACKRALRWEFWRGIYMALCGGDASMEQKVVAQLRKILTKLDSEMKFTISTRHFRRIFERHISSDDMDVVTAALALDDSCSDESKAGDLLRYDVLLKLVFGTSDLNDDHFFESSVRKKLLRKQGRLQAYTTEPMTVKGPSHRLSLQDFYDTFVDQADEHPLTMVELFSLFGSVDSRHEGSVEVKALKNFLSRGCWRDDIRSSEGTRTSATDATSSRESCDVESIRKFVAKGCANYDLYRVLDDLSRKSQGWLAQSVVVKELMKMMHELGISGVQQDDLKAFVHTMSIQTEMKAARPPSRDGIHCDAFFNTLFDWNAMVSSMKLPHSLVEVNKVFDKFDWEHVGSIRCDDWNKAYRLLSHDQQGMAEWEIDVLYRRFPGQGHLYERDQKIDYARLIVFLLDFQQRQARKSLQTCVVLHFEERFASARSSMSTAELERIFRALDTDNKGHFNAADLKKYLIKEFERDTAANSVQDDRISLLNNADALAFAMRLLADGKVDRPRRSLDGGSGPSTIVTFERFREIASSFSSARTKSSLDATRSSSQRVHPSGMRSQMAGDENERHTISSLRVLEITILEIASEFADSKGNILPARAFRYLSLGSTQSADKLPRPTPPSSPLRRSSLTISPTNRTTGLSSKVHKNNRELEASTLDPLTPARLKQLLQIYHRVDVSTHLVSQFFLHIGSPSKYFLDLVHFAQWAAPLSVEMQVKVRAVVRQMIVKGKGGVSNPPLQFVAMPLLVSKLHQLNIPLHKQELMALLRHFGMEDDLEAVDYALFLQRLYELNTSMTSS
ncbi:hypothetical protein PF006_g11652 [Phytophthora fragariae]|uniref:EF-hand domain-containing protein n=1 Tax=Phytophthora fragariae TaxID=53985 RepID=A0A6A3U0P8_9STRA|nr:hypothetical protein PF006_g11652 [Phytophthora fragariae]